MAITKRTRFEILRRDNHTCQYCGAKAPDAVLHIDHVEPVSLGGSDKPDNLVAACKDCNTGKASIAPDSPLVSGLGERVAAYALGMQDKMTRFRADIESLDDYTGEFLEQWNSWKTSDDAKPTALPADYEMSLLRWKQMGIPMKVFELAIPKAMLKQNREWRMKDEDIFAYMAGIVWNMINDRQIDYTVTKESAAVYTAAEADEFASREYSQGKRSGRAQLDYVDAVRHHIDQTTTMHLQAVTYRGAA